MKGEHIYFICVGVLTIGLIGYTLYDAQSPHEKAITAKANADFKAFNDTENTIKSTNNTLLLKSIYITALDKGADPTINCHGFWEDCDYTQWIYFDAHAKYEVLIQ